jgi:hypothetical protein
MGIVRLVCWHVRTDESVLAAQTTKLTNGPIQGLDGCLSGRWAGAGCWLFCVVGEAKWGWVPLWIDASSRRHLWCSGHELHAEWVVCREVFCISRPWAQVGSGAPVAC